MKKINDELLYQYTKKAEEMILNQIPKETELKHSFSKKFQKKMRQLISSHSQMNRKKYVAAAILILCFISVSMWFGNPGYRVKAIAFANKIATALGIEKEKEEPVKEELVVRVPTYIPETYIQGYSEKTDQEFTTSYRNKTKESSIEYSQKLLTYGSYQLEAAKKEKIHIAEQKVNIGYKGENVFLQWNDQTYSYLLKGFSVSENEMIKVAESVIEQGPEGGKAKMINQVSVSYPGIYWHTYGRENKSDQISISAIQERKILNFIKKVDFYQ